MSGNNIMHFVCLRIYNTNKKCQVMTQARIVKFAVDLLQHMISALNKRLLVTKQALFAHHTAYQVFKPNSHKSGRGTMAGNISEIESEITFFDVGVINKIATEKQGGNYGMRDLITFFIRQS